MKEFRIAIFASGNGTNAEEIVKHFQGNSIIKVVLFLSNNPQAYALTRAEKHSIPSRVFTKAQFRENEEVLGWLREERVTHIVLAGFLWLLPDYLVKAFPNRIINIHPALLPKFGGSGMYGIHVHKAVKVAGEKETGITIHEVNERYDEGKILFQEKCIIESMDTPEQIAQKVHALEHRYYPGEIEKWIVKDFSS